MKKEKSIESIYVVLDEIDHVRKRLGIYAGSPTMEKRSEYLYGTKMELRDVEFIPALIKVISEAIDNSVDEHIRHPEKLDTLKVEFDDGSIIVSDNGGIPVVKHKEFDKYVPEIIFGTLRSGSNYNDAEDQSTIGTNGLGCKLLNILSTQFTVETADGTNQFKQVFTEGMRKHTVPKITESSRNFTRLTFTPDYKFFGIKGLDKDHKDKIVKRLVDIAGCNPNLKVYVDGRRLNIKSFKDYIDLYTDEYVYDENDKWKVGIAHSDGFQQISFVNGVETYMGGSHVDYVANQVVNAVREYFKKKKKIDVKPSDIKGHMQFFISANINRPKFSSQTKENMVSAPADYKSSWECPDKLIQKIIKSPIIQAVLDWIEAKEKAAEMAELRKLNKTLDKGNHKKVEKFHDATSTERSKTSIYLCEGDSASGGVLSGRNSKFDAVFPLRGKPINVYEMSVRDVIENKEFKNIMTITGLQLGVKVNSINDIRFGKIVITTDADLDGWSIRGLLMNMFYKFWPELFDLGVIHVFDTPAVKVKSKKKDLWFYSITEFEAWKESNKDEKYDYKFYKGLGTSTSAEWKEYFLPENMEKNIIRIDIDSKTDSDMFRLLFSKENGATDRRKEWMNIQEVV